MALSRKNPSAGDDELERQVSESPYDKELSRTDPDAP
jgi:hypothetical protein